jgi:hypothetical protein
MSSFVYRPKKTVFKSGDRVRVVGGFGWIGQPVGTIRRFVRVCPLRVGEDFEYYVEFDTPAQTDDGMGPYRAACILSGDMELIEKTPDMIA